jgi:alkyl hydroperoxide reductase subunit AhpC
MEQVVDLQEDKGFQSLDVEVVSLSPDPLSMWRAEAQRLDIRTPVVSDESNKVAQDYGVMRWAVGAEPGHTFVLVDTSGKVAWVRDYGAEEHGGLMYVPPDNLTRQVAQHVDQD